MTYYKIKAINKETKEVKWLNTLGAICFSKDIKYLPEEMLTTNEMDIALVSVKGIVELILMVYINDFERVYTIEEEEK